MNKFKKIPKKDRPYSVVPYNKNWTKIFKKEKKIIADILGGNAIKIEHIGSTSVKGMWAKPQIDILVIVKDLNVINNLIPQLESNNYQYIEEFNKFNERYFVKDALSGQRLISVHIHKQGSDKSLSQIYLREYLKTHPEARKLYSNIKRKAYQSGANRQEYPEKKKEVLQKLIDEAKEWGEKNKVSDILNYTNQKKFSQTWHVLYIISTILFTIIGMAMIIFDKAIFNGLQYLITAIIFSLGLTLNYKKIIKINFSNSKIFLGFIFSVIGLTNGIYQNIQIPIWSLGIILFLSGLFNKKNNDS